MDLKKVDLVVFGIMLFLLPLVEIKNELAAIVLLIIGAIYFYYCREKKSYLTIIICAIALINAQWAIAQFAAQKDLNLQMVGESKIERNVAGVAKFGEARLIRAYGQYSHANILGGMMVISLGIWLMVFDGRYEKLGLIVRAVLFLGCLVSFSRSAMAAMIILLIVNYIKGEKSVLKLMIPMIIWLIFISLLFVRATDTNDQAVRERLIGVVWSIGIIKQNIWHGIGMSGYKDELLKYVLDNNFRYEVWQIDYVHSAPMLILAKTGMVGLFLIAGGAVFVIKKCYDAGKAAYLLALTPLLLFDHYLVTQNAPLFTVILFVLISMKINTEYGR